MCQDGLEILLELIHNCAGAVCTCSVNRVLVSHSCLIRCLISCHWFEKWSKFIHIALNVGIDGVNDSSHPGPVTNFMLIKFALPNFRPMRLKKNLVEGFDYKLIPEIAWDLLIQWYGISERSTRLSRYTVHGM